MNNYLPSKKFIKFFLIVFIVALLIGIASFISSKSKKYESKPEDLVANSSDQPFYDVDTDGDGLKDWEEALWQTNPNSPDSDGDGISDKDEVEAKRVEIAEKNRLEGKKDSTPNENLTQTEIFARQFFGTAMLANQKGVIDQATIESLGSAFSDAVKDSFIEDPFTLADIHLSNISKSDYQKNLVAVFSPLASRNIDEVAVIDAYIANQNTETRKSLDSSVRTFQELSSSLLKMKVPYGAAGIHLSLINNAVKVGLALTGIKNMESDPLLAVVGINQFSRYSKEFQTTLTNLQNYLNSNDIMYKL